MAGLDAGQVIRWKSWHRWTAACLLAYIYLAVTVALQRQHDAGSGLAAGRRAIEDAAPQHVHNVRRHFIDLLTPAELDTLAALNERVLRHLAAETLPRPIHSQRARALPLIRQGL